MLESISTNEQQLLRCILENPECLLSIDENYFVSSIGKDLYTTLIGLFNKDIPFISTNIVNEGNSLNGSINIETITKLRQIEYSPDKFDYYFSRLKQDYAKTQIALEDMKAIASEFLKKGEIDLTKVKEIHDSIARNINLIENKKKFLYTLPEMEEIYRATLKERESGKSHFPTGDSALNTKILQGFYPGYITTIFAATGIGKSIYALRLINGQINRKIPSLYLSLEMDMISTMDRLIAMRNNISIESLYLNRNNSLANSVYEALEKEREEFKKIKLFYFVEEPNISLSDFWRIVKDAKRLMKVDYLVATIDLLTMIQDFSKTDAGTQAAQYEHNMNEVHAKAKEEHIHIVGVVQASKRIEEVKVDNMSDIRKMKPTKNSIKNSGAIAERSRVVIGAFREKYYAETFFPDDPLTGTMEDILEIDILKQNMAKVGHLKYRYIAEKARIQHYPEKEVGDSNEDEDKNDNND